MQLSPSAGKKGGKTRALKARILKEKLKSVQMQTLSTPLDCFIAAKFSLNA